MCLSRDCRHAGAYCVYCYEGHAAEAERDAQTAVKGLAEGAVQLERDLEKAESRCETAARLANLAQEERDRLRVDVREKDALIARLEAELAAVRAGRERYSSELGFAQPGSAAHSPQGRPP